MPNTCLNEKPPSAMTESDSPRAVQVPPTYVITPDGNGNGLNLKEVWTDRHVLRHMVRRDLAVRYKETVVGVLWAVLQPLAMMVVFTVVFGSRGSSMHAGSTPYPVSLFLGLIIWQFVSLSVTRSADALMSNAHILSKIYFCRLSLPLTPIVVNLVDFGVRMVLLALLMLFFGVAPSASIVLVPVLIAVMVLVTTSICLWLSALSAIYRDIKQVVPFAVQAWFFLTPVFYDPSMVIAERWMWLYYLNPVAGLISGFRWAVFGDGSLPWINLSISGIAAIFLFVSGAYFFRKVERDIVDVL